MTNWIKKKESRKIERSESMKRERWWKKNVDRYNAKERKKGKNIKEERLQKGMREGRNENKVERGKSMKGKREGNYNKRYKC